MTVSSVGIDEPAVPDKFLHSNARTISSVVREDQYVLPGEGAYPTYSVIAGGISVATTADHVLQIMADGTNYTRLRSVRISPTDDIPAAASALLIGLYRLTTAGTGGGALGIAAYDTADTYGGAAMSLPTAKGTEDGAALRTWRIWLPAAIDASRDSILWTVQPGMKPIIFGTATTSGLAFKVSSGIASATIDIVCEFSTTSYL